MSHLTNTQLPMSHIPTQHSHVYEYSRTDKIGSQFTGDRLSKILESFQRLDAYKDDPETLIELVLIDKFGEGGVVVRRPAGLRNHDDFDLWLCEWDLTDILYDRVVPMIEGLIIQLGKYHLQVGIERNRYTKEEQHSDY